MFLEKVLADPPKEIESTGDASIAAKGDKALREVAFSLWLADALKVHHSDVEFFELVKQGHIVVLRLDRMREKEVSLIRKQIRNGHFFYSEYDRSFRYIFLNYGANICKLILAVAAVCGGLDDNADPGSHYASYLKRSQRAATLPFVLAFA